MQATILYVEDDEKQRQIAVKLLKKNDYAVYFFTKPFDFDKLLEKLMENSG
jgi:CheY-like chemotaxis protein